MADANNIPVDEQIALLAEASCKALHGNCAGQITEPCFACNRAAEKQVKAIERAGFALIRVRWDVPAPRTQS